MLYDMYLHAYMLAYIVSYSQFNYIGFYNKDSERHSLNAKETNQHPQKQDNSLDRGITEATNLEIRCNKRLHQTAVKGLGRGAYVIDVHVPLSFFTETELGHHSTSVEQENDPPKDACNNLSLGKLIYYNYILLKC